MKTTKEMIAVMSAFEEGKNIEYRRIKCVDWNDIINPQWDWSLFDYRIKPEPPEQEYVPYESAEEFFQEVLKHKGWVMIPHKKKGDFSNCYYPVGSFCEDDKYVDIMCDDPDRGVVSFDKLLKQYIWADDGTPCGKPKQIS